MNKSFILSYGRECIGLSQGPIPSGYVCMHACKNA